MPLPRDCLRERRAHPEDVPRFPSPLWLWRSLRAPQIVLGFTCLLLAGTARPQSVPAGGVSLVAAADLAVDGNFWGGSTADGPVAVRTIVDVTGQPFARAARIDVQRPDGLFYSSGINGSSTRAVAAGDVVLLHFFMRAVETTDESGAVFAQAFAEGPAPSYTKSLFQQVSAGAAWTEYFLPFEVEEDYAAGQFTIAFGFGESARPAVLELGGVEVLWYGKSRTLDEMPRTSFSYEGRNADAPWRAEAAARIEQYRKANYTVRVVDPTGAPVAGATVRVRLRRHAFPFGTAFVASRVMDPGLGDNAIYRAKLLELFNAGSTENDLKWPPWDGEWGSAFGREQTLAALEWLQRRDFHLRGHVLVWPSERNLPNHLKPLLDARDPTVPQRVRDHIREIVTATRDTLVEWDVLNEPYDNYDLMTVYGNDEMVTWFQEARAAHPTAQLYINDYGIVAAGGQNTAHQDHYEQTIAYLVEQGAPIDGIGMQGHFGATPTGMARAWAVFERFANAFPQLKIKITEFDVDTDDAELQADYTRDFLTLAFSHPAVAGFQVWGFWEGAHWRERAAMYALDWTERPNGAAFRELVHEVWQTDETQTTGGSGQVSGRGFHGRYDVTVTVNGRSRTEPFTLAPGGSVLNVTFDPGAVRSQLANISTRGQVGAGNDVMIAGFVIRGSGTKEVLIRGIGPKLADFNVNGVLPNPRLALFREGETQPLVNDQWSPGLAPVFGEAGAFGLDGDTDSAALRLSLTAGRYTAQLSGTGDTTGVGIVEVYDLATGAGIAPINLSTRGIVGTEDRVLIGGFAVQGPTPMRLLIRGVGPGLAPWLSGYVEDPTLDLYRMESNPPVLLASNQDWETGNDAAAVATASAQVGAFPLADGSRDAVLLVTLDPGRYSVSLSGAGGTTGVGLIEVYEVE